jgi:hypothetical protein
MSEHADAPGTLDVMDMIGVIVGAATVGFLCLTILVLTVLA